MSDMVPVIKADDYPNAPFPTRFVLMLAEALGLPKGQKVTKIVIEAHFKEVPKAYIQRLITDDSQFEAIAGAVEIINVHSVEVNPDLSLKVEPQ